MRRLFSGISLLSLVFLLGCLSPITEEVSTTTSTTTSSTTTSTSTTTRSTTTTTTLTTTPTTTTEPVTSTTESATTLTDSVAPGTFTLAELEHDFDQFVDYIDLNPQLFTDEAELNALILAQRELLVHGMTSLEFYRVLAVVAAGIRCGHTGVQVSPTDIDFIFGGDHTYPIEVRLFAGHLRVIATSGETEIEIGDEITAIDGVEIPALTLNLMRFLTADGEGTSMKLRVLRDYYLSYYLLFLAPDETFEVEYSAMSSGETKTETISRDTIDSEAETTPPPFESVFTEEYAVLIVREFYPHDAVTLSSYYAFFDSFFTQLEAAGTHHLILDIRGNSGGDPRVASRLFSYLAATPQPYFAENSPNYYPGLKSEIPLSSPHFDGHLYTLIDGFCFSTTGHFAALLQYQNIGMFIGSETGGSYVCSDSSASYTLTNTRLEFRTSRMVWQVAVEGFELGRGILPDMECFQTFEDYQAGIDTVLEKALEQILIQSALEGMNP